MLYPMYVVRICDFLGMRMARPHQVLKASGLVVECDGRQQPIVTFVSHQWCGKRHPDPKFAQLHILQGVIRRVISGTLRVHVDLHSAIVYKLKPTLNQDHLQDLAAGCLWYDYFSVPQPAAPEAESSQHTDLSDALGLAVASLAAYVDRCRFFLILAPCVAHEEGHLVNYLTWKSRGWCRFERMARVLSVDATMLLVRHVGGVYQVGAQDYLTDPVGWGEFTVKQDRANLAPKVEGMLREKLAWLRKANRATEYRDLLAHRDCLLEGLPIPRPPSDRYASVEEFMEAFLAAPSPELVNRTQPLMRASLLGDASVLQMLLESRAEVDTREPEHRPRRLGVQGMAPLHYAVMHGHVGASQLLLEHRADVNSRDVFGDVPLMFVPDRPGVLQLLVDRRADLSARNVFGQSSLELAVMRGKREGAAALLAAGHPREGSADGLNALHIAVAFDADPAFVRCLVEAGVSLTERFRPRFGSRYWMMTRVLATAHRFGDSGYRSAYIFHCLGGTPLTFAMAERQRDIAEVMLDQNADPEARNVRGLTTYEVGRLFDMLFHLSTS